MSADNYLFVRKYRGRYYIEMRFASNEYDERSGPNPHFGIFKTADQAVRAAFEAEASDYYEYGVKVANQVMADWARESAHKAD